MKTIVVKDEGKYYKIASERLHVPVSNSDYRFKTEMDFPIRRVYKDGDSYNVLYNIKNVENFVTVSPRSFDEPMRSLGFGTAEVRKIMRYVNTKGLRLKTRIGFYWAVKVRRMENGKYEYENARMLSKKGNREVCFPNVYRGTGDVCWGNVMSSEKMRNFNSLEEVSGTFAIFMESVFNNELEKSINQGALREVILTREYDPNELGDAEVEMIELIKRWARRADFLCDGDMFLLLVATVFDMDNIELENRVIN